MLPSYFNLAKLARVHSNHPDYKIGVVITKKKPVAIAFNTVKTHPLFANGKTSFSLHAEINAILKARCDLEGATIWVYRETFDGIPANAKPCKNCLKEILSVGMSNLYFTINDEPYFTRISLHK